MKNQEVSEKIGELVKKYRLSQNLTQEELGYKCKLDRNQISLIERGKVDLRCSTLAAILSCIDVTVLELYTCFK